MDLMTPDEIAATLINGNISDAREAILTGRTQKEAALCALLALHELCWDKHTRYQIDRLVRCLDGGS